MGHTAQWGADAQAAGRLYRPGRSEPTASAHHRSARWLEHFAGAIDGSFGPATKASVQAFQTWGGVTADGFVGDQTWGVQLGAAGATLESKVGLQYAI